jgi:hypothetical protein
MADEAADGAVVAAAAAAASEAEDGKSTMLVVYYEHPYEYHISVHCPLSLSFGLSIFLDPLMHASVMS